MEAYRGHIGGGGAHPHSNRPFHVEAPRKTTRVHERHPKFNYILGRSAPAY